MDLGTLLARYHRAFNDRDFDVWREVFDEDVELLVDGVPFRGVDAAVAYGAGSVSQFPGLYIASERIVAESGDTIVSEIGLVTGDPAGGHGRQQGMACEICRVRDGRIVSCRSYYMPGPAGRADTVRVPIRAEAVVVAEEQAALRRVATLVARGVAQEELFAAVTEETRWLVNAGSTSLLRFEPDDTVTLVAAWNARHLDLPIGSSRPVDEDLRSMRETGRPWRRGPAELPPTGTFVEEARALGMRTFLGVPIVVEGRMWGAVFASSTADRPFADDAEARLAGFTELVATAIANAQARVELRGHAEEQAALRQVATLVAGGALPAQVFTAVAEGIRRLYGADNADVCRFEPDGTSAVVVGSGGEDLGRLPAGMQLRDYLPAAMVRRTGRAAQVHEDGWSSISDPVADALRELGIRSIAASPIIVEGRLWGVVTALTRQGPFPSGTADRIADFTELAATAIANAKAQQELRELADIQAALRRLATLVARGEPPEAVFAAATREALWHFGDGTARMIRFEVDGTATLVANEGTTGPHVRVGGRWEGYPPGGLTATVRQTGQAARVDDYRDVPGAEVRLREGILSSVAMPIYVNGRLWGMIAVGSGQAPLPPDTKQRMSEFTGLVATAVANAQNRAELNASRARIVAASDEARRRIERDLHDGGQQRLLALALRLRSAAAPLERDEIGTEVRDVATGLLGVIDELREISRGIHPAILSTAGLRAALRALARRTTIPVNVDVRIDRRLPEPVEVGAYYVVSEMLTNAAKHARASVVEVEVEASGGRLRVRVRDDGVGGADPQLGSGLVGLKDRIEALGGTLSLHSPAGAGTTVSCELPVSAGTDDGSQSRRGRE
jgi:signal transduction histidine kinase/ketosteroid isomerase-like protein